MYYYLFRYVYFIIFSWEKYWIPNDFWQFQTYGEEASSERFPYDVSTEEMVHFKFPLITSKGHRETFF